ncbi:hypothetical protein WME91_46785 [Sorangium sp. So ce269]
MCEHNSNTTQPAVSSATHNNPKKPMNTTAQLEEELKQAKIRAEIAQAQAPWWRKANTVTVLTAIITATVPGTTAVYGYFQKEKELALQQQRQTHEITLAAERQEYDIEMARTKHIEDLRASYLDRLKDQSSRLRTLRFLAATATDPNLASWASKEKDIIDKENDELKSEIESLQKKSAELIEKSKQSLANSRVLAEGYRRDAEAARKAADKLMQQLNSTPPSDPCSGHSIRSCTTFNNCMRSSDSNACNGMRNAAAQAGCYAGPWDC